MPTHHEDHIAGKGDNSLQHYNLVHKFIPMPQLMKIPAAKGSSGQGMGRGKSGHMKNLNSIMHENYEESTSLTLRTKNSKRPSRMLAKNWQQQWLPL